MLFIKKSGGLIHMNKVKNAADLKYSNKKQILNIIRKSPLSRADIARKTGLTRAAVSIIIDEMIQEQLLIEIGVADSSLGRKPIHLDLNPCYYFAAGVYISRGKCAIGMIDMKGNVIMYKEIKGFSEIQPYEVLDLIVKELNNISAENKIPLNKILGLGVSAPGPLDIYNGTILDPPNFEKWKGIEIVKYLKEQLSLNIFMDNNSTSLALAEKYFGIGKALNSFMLMVVDSGIGAGIIIKDEIYRGIGGFGSEVGHTSISLYGKQCSCGNSGCLEMYASIPAILEEAQKFDDKINSWDEVVDRAMCGNNLCMGIIEKEARYLSAGIVNTMNILELEAVVLTGYIKYKPQLLIDKISEYVSKTSITKDIRKIYLDISHIMEHEDVVSAATIVLDVFFNNN